MSECYGCKGRLLWDFCIKRFGERWVEKRAEEQADYETAMLRECEGPDPDLAYEQHLIERANGARI